MEETDNQYMSRLDRDSAYRMKALELAIVRAGQDGGIQGTTVDVFNLAEQYYAFFSGEDETKKPTKETFKKTKGLDES